MAHIWPDELIQTLRQRGGKPALTWYSATGDRIEISGAVTANWVVKQTGWLDEEFSPTTGSRVRLDLPLHWRTVTWALAAWTARMTIVLDGSAPLVVTATPSPQIRDAKTRHTQITQIGVALGALARQLPAPVSGCIDATSAVLAQPDQLLVTFPPTPTAVALEQGNVQWTFADLSALTGSSSRRLLQAGATNAARLFEVLETLGGGGSVVLVEAEHAIWSDAQKMAQLCETELIS